MSLNKSSPHLWLNKTLTPQQNELYTKLKDIFEKAWIRTWVGPRIAILLKEGNEAQLKRFLSSNPDITEKGLEDLWQTLGKPKGTYLPQVNIQKIVERNPHANPSWFGSKEG